MKQRLLELYNRYQILLLFLVCALVLTLSFLQVLPGAYHAGSMGEYHVFAYNEYRYSNIMSNFTNREFPMFDKTGYLTPGIEYPALMSMLYRLTTMVALSGHIGT